MVFVFHSILFLSCACLWHLFQTDHFCQLIFGGKGDVRAETVWADFVRAHPSAEDSDPRISSHSYTVQSDQMAEALFPFQDELQAECSDDSHRSVKGKNIQIYKIYYFLHVTCKAVPIKEKCTIIQFSHVIFMFFYIVLPMC